MTQLVLKGLRKTFNGIPAVHRLDLNTEEGEFISLLGPSGCGKTTTLRCVAGFEYPDAGRVLLDGTDVTEQPPERRDIGMVFQNYALFPHLTVYRNLAFGLEMRRIDKAEIRRRVDEVLGMVQLSSMLDRYPRQLSGGQQQRVALARALVIEPRLLLLDEPLANLDAVLRDEMRVFIRELQRRVGITTLYVTHDQAEAMVMSDRIGVMLAGRLAQLGPPEDIYLRPRSVEVARFIGRANLVAGTVERAAGGADGGAGGSADDGGSDVRGDDGAGRGGQHEAVRVRTALGLLHARSDLRLQAGQQVHVALRPEAIGCPAAGVRHDGTVHPCTVARVYFLGAAVEHVVDCTGGTSLVVQTSHAQRLAQGDHAALVLRADNAWIIAAAPRGVAAMTLVHAADRRQRIPMGRRSFWLIAPALVLIGVFLVLPYLNIVVMSLREPAVGSPYGEGLTLGNYTRVLGDDYFLGVLADTLLLGVTTTVVCVLLGYPVAYHLARTRSRWQSLLYVLVLSPLLVGVVVRSFGWLILLSGNGVINRALIDTGLVETGFQLMNNRLGVTVALVHVFLPFMILPLIGVIQSIDPVLETAGQSLGASRFMVFRRLVLPLSWPGIQAGSILVFVLTLSAYVTPVMLGGAQMKTMSVLVVQNLIDNFQWPAGAALALVLSVCGLAAVTLYARMTGLLMKGVQ